MAEPGESVLINFGYRSENPDRSRLNHTLRCKQEHGADQQNGGRTHDTAVSLAENDESVQVR